MLLYSIGQVHLEELLIDFTVSIKQNNNVSIVINVHCPECPPGGTIGHPVDSKKRFCRLIMEGT